MTQEFQIHDYAFAYCIHELIYYLDGPTSPYRSNRFSDMTCQALLEESVYFSYLEKVVKKFPWIESFLEKSLEELFHELPKTSVVTSRLSRDDKVIEYFIGGKSVETIAYDYMMS